MAVTEPRVMAGPRRRETPAGGTRPGPRRRGRAIYSSRRGDIRDGRLRAPRPGPAGKEGAGGRAGAGGAARRRAPLGGHGRALRARPRVSGAGWRF